MMGGVMVWRWSDDGVEMNEGVQILLPIHQWHFACNHTGEGAVPIGQFIIWVKLQIT